MTIISALARQCLHLVYRVQQSNIFLVGEWLHIYAIWILKSNQYWTSAKYMIIYWHLQMYLLNSCKCCSYSMVYLFSLLSLGTQNSLCHLDILMGSPPAVAHSGEHHAWSRIQRNGFCITIVETIDTVRVAAINFKSPVLLTVWLRQKSEGALAKNRQILSLVTNDAN